MSCHENVMDYLCNVAKVAFSFVDMFMYVKDILIKSPKTLLFLCIVFFQTLLDISTSFKTSMKSVQSQFD